MDVEELLAGVPHQVQASSERPDLRYEIVGDLIATHGAPGGPVVHAVGAAGPAAGEGTMGPVYRRMPGGGVVVPTGRVFVRFAEGERAEDHGAELAEAGYDIEEVPSYAPHAAWVRARDRDIGGALAHLDRLQAHPAIKNVEPQMLGEVSRRD